MHWLPPGHGGCCSLAGQQGTIQVGDLPIETQASRLQRLGFSRGLCLGLSRELFGHVETELSEERPRGLASFSWLGP